MSRVLSGIAVSHGLAIGQAKIWRPTLAAGDSSAEDTPEAQMFRFCTASHRVRQELRMLEQATRDRLGHGQGILDAQAEMAVDPLLTESVKQRVTDGMSAEDAVREAGDKLARVLEALTDPYLRERAEDVRLVCGQIAAVLAEKGEEDFVLPADTVLVADELSAAVLARLFGDTLRGLVLATGTATSHVALFAKGWGLPAVLGCESALEEIRDGDVVAVDGSTGKVWVRPDEASLHKLSVRSRSALALAPVEAECTPALTRDGRGIAVMANIACVGDAALALRLGADGVGLVRSELFLFLHRQDLPSEDEQFSEYRALLEAMAPRSVVIRTLDSGGDKQMQALNGPIEQNPFLGWRGVRLWAEEERLWKPQIRALLRAAHYGVLRVLIPMVSDVKEILHVRSLFDRMGHDLGPEAGPYKLGAMIEVPSAALTADALAAEVDFFSIGTNDLVQYTLAADRGNAKTANFQDPLHPAVQKLVEMTVTAAHAHRIPVAVCGDAAADARVIPWLVKSGVDELSVPVQAMPDVRRAIRNMTVA